MNSSTTTISKGLFSGIPGQIRSNFGGLTNTVYVKFASYWGAENKINGDVTLDFGFLHKLEDSDLQGINVYWGSGFDKMADKQLTGKSLGTTTAPTPTPVPLPAAAPMLIAGLGALGFVARRRKKAT